MMKRLFLVLLLPVLVLGGLYLAGTYVYENRLYASVSDRISEETKQKLRDTVLVFQAKAELEREVDDLKRHLAQTEEVQEVFEVALRNNPDLPETLPFYRVAEQMFEAGRDRFFMVSYESAFIPLSHFGRRAYVEQYQGDLLLVTAMGTIGRVPLDEMTGESFDMPTVQTNLRTLIPNPEFYKVNEFSIKDVLVREDQLLLSYTKALSDGCYTMAITAADLRAEPLIFKDIFVPDECVRADNDYGAFDANQTGGRMLVIGPDTLLFSTGEWLHRELAQDPDSLFGKIVEIDLRDGSTVMKSMGHRNPQGLYYDAEANVIINSEHGPEGGDEININRNPDGDPENFGWPISSYGEHYSTNPENYVKAPLHKSHADYGFVEPEKYFVPSLSPGPLVRLNDPRDPERYALLMGTMGFDYREGDESLHIFDLNEDFEIISQDRIILDDRVRDMIHLPGTQEYVLFLEGGDYEFGTISLLEHNP